MEDVGPFEVPLRGHAVRGGYEVGFLGGEDPPDVLQGPHEKGALPSLRIGVLGAEEASTGMAHLTQEVVQRLLGHHSVAWLSEHLPGMQIAARQLGVVVQHLLEVGDEPALVGGVAVKASAQLIVDAPRCHGIEGGLDHDLKFRASAKGQASEQGFQH